MNILLSRNHSISSWLIRLATWSRYSHCAIVDGLHVIESTFWGGGVVRRPLDEFMDDHPGAELLEVPCPDDEAGLRWAREQVGKPYDWTAILGFLVRRDWQEPDSWFCAEHVEGTIKAAGRDRFRVGLSRITPQHVWMVRT